MLMGAGPSGGGAAEVVAPDAPTDFAVTDRTDSTFTVGFTPTTGQVRIQAQMAGGDWISAGDAFPVDTGFIVTGCLGNTLYDLRIRAEQGGAHSDWVVLLAQLTSPSAVSGSVTNRGADSLTLGWDAIPAGLSVHVQWKNTGDDWGSALGDVADLTDGSYQITGLSANASYDLRIQVVSGDLSSEWTEIDAEWTRPAPPTGLAGSPGGYASVDLSWDAFDDGVTDSSLRYTILQNGVPTGLSGLTGTATNIGTNSPSETDDWSLVAVGYLSGLESAPCDAVTVVSGAGTVPSCTVPPVITGGDGTLSVTSPGTWIGDPSSFSFSYVWTGNGVPTGETSDTQGGLQVGVTYVCTVSASNAAGSASDDSNGLTP